MEEEDGEWEIDGGKGNGAEGEKKVGPSCALQFKPAEFLLIVERCNKQSPGASNTSSALSQHAWTRTSPNPFRCHRMLSTPTDAPPAARSRPELRASIAH